MSDKTIYVYSTQNYAMSPYTDADTGDSHTYTVVEQGQVTLPAFMSLSGYTLIVNPSDNSMSGIYDIEIKVVDNNSAGDAAGAKTAIDVFRITVIAVNDPPVFDTIPFNNQNCNVYDSCSYDIGSFTDVNPLDLHTYTITANGGGLPGFITWTEGTTTFNFFGHTNADRGTYLISVTITDNDSVGSGGV